MCVHMSDDRGVRDSERKAAVMHFDTDQVCMYVCMYVCVCMCVVLNVIVEIQRPVDYVSNFEI